MCSFSIIYRFKNKYVFGFNKKTIVDSPNEYIFIVYCDNWIYRSFLRVFLPKSNVKSNFGLVSRLLISPLKTLIFGITLHHLDHLENSRNLFLTNSEEASIFISVKTVRLPLSSYTFFI